MIEVEVNTAQPIEVSLVNPTIYRFGSVVDVSLLGLTPSDSSPTIAVARQNSAKFRQALENYSVINITRPGDYYFGDENNDDLGILIPSNKAIIVAPGVNLWRHTDFYSGTSGFGSLFRFAETTMTENVYIGGGGAIGRKEGSGAPSSDGMHTVRFVNYKNLIIENLTIKDTTTTASGKFAILSSNGRLGRFRNLHFSGLIALNNGVSSDGVHLTGFHNDVIVEGCSGACNDNPIAAMISDYASVMDANVVPGSIDGLIIRNNRFENCNEHVRITGNFFPSSSAGLISTIVGDITTVTYDPLAHTLSEANIADSITAFGDGHYLKVIGGTGVTDLMGNAVSSSFPLYVRVRRKIDANTIEVETRISSGTSTVTDLVVENAYYTALYTIRNVLVENQRGSVKASNNGMSIGDDPVAAPNTLIMAPMENIIYRNCAVTVPTAGYAALAITGSGLRDIRIENVEALPDSNISAISINMTQARNVLRYAYISTRRKNAGNNGHALNIATSIKRLDIGELICESTGTSGGLAAINVAGTSSYHPVIDLITADNIELRCLSSGMTRRVLSMVNNQVPWIKNFRCNRLLSENADFVIGGAGNTALANKRMQMHVGDLMVLGALNTISLGQVDLIYDRLYRDLTTGTYQATASVDRATIQKSGSMQFVIREEDFTAAATSQAINLRTGLSMYTDRFLPRGATITGVRTDLITAFSGGGVSAAILDIGTASSTNKYLNDLNVFTGATSSTYTAITTGNESISATTDLAIVLVTTSANVSALTAGEIRITFYFEQ